MMRGSPGVVPLLVVTCLTLTPTSAHHSIAKFDGRQIIQVAGVVTDLRWINPHVSFGLDSSDGRHWVVEMQAPSTMMLAGWSRDTLRAGDAITVFAHPLRQEDAAATERRTLYAGIVLADGRTLGCAQPTPCRVEP